MQYKRFMRSNVDPAKLNQLVNGQYFNAIRLGYGVGTYLTHSFYALPDQGNSIWVPQKGQYNALTGYWIFRNDCHQCWQAVNCNGPLALWNSDGHAQGNPEDWELFIFELVDANTGSVRVRNIYGRYVRYGSPFVCDADANNSATFTVEFC